MQPPAPFRTAAGWQSFPGAKSEFTIPVAAEPQAAISSRDVGTPEDRLQIERDLYRHLLGLRGIAPMPGIESGLRELLQLIVKATDAARGYLEVYASSDASSHRWRQTVGCSPEEVDEIHAMTSRGIAASAIAGARTLHVPYAALDERFSDRPSVQAQRLEAVICAPVGGLGAGVLYLEGRRGAGPFADIDVALTTEVAAQLGPALDLAARAVSVECDPTRPYRERMRLDGIVGRSPALAKVFAQLEPFVRLDVTLLITGATGTGKTQIARAIHDNSPRRSGPFVELNCAAIPEGLIESELFGAMPGAFPGARRTPGKVEAAEGGTLFLDEIAEIPFAAQGKLLQLLQSRQYYALASTRLVTANVRIITATNHDLASRVAERRFRDDLYYRINVVSVRMPSLAERREDIGILVDAMLTRLAAEHQISPLPASPQLRLALEHRNWEGNVRMLRSQIEAALILACAEGAPQVEIRHLAGDAPAVERPPTFHEATHQFQREFLRRELEHGDWNVTAVSDRLDLSRAHIYNLMHQFGIKRK